MNAFAPHHTTIVAAERATRLISFSPASAALHLVERTGIPPLSAPTLRPEPIEFGNVFNSLSKALLGAIIAVMRRSGGMATKEELSA